MKSTQIIHGINVAQNINTLRDDSFIATPEQDYFLLIIVVFGLIFSTRFISL